MYTYTYVNIYTHSLHMYMEREIDKQSEDVPLKAHLIFFS